jgi:hypothetical protein
LEGTLSLKERLETLTIIETACYVIYSRLCRLCTEEKNLWRRLAQAENNHVVAIIRAKKYLEAGNLPEDLVHPSLSEMKKTLAWIESIEEMIKDYESISLPEALKLALEIENQECKEYFMKRLETGGDSDVIKILRRLAGGTIQHVEDLRQLSEKYISPNQTSQSDPDTEKAD